MDHHLSQDSPVGNRNSQSVASNLASEIEELCKHAQRIRELVDEEYKSWARLLARAEATDDMTERLDEHLRRLLNLQERAKDFGKRLRRLAEDLQAEFETRPAVYRPPPLAADIGSAPTACANGSLTLPTATQIKAGSEFTQAQMQYGCNNSTHKMYEDTRARIWHALQSGEKLDWFGRYITPRMYEEIGHFDRHWEYGDWLIEKGFILPPSRFEIASRYVSTGDAVRGDHVDVMVELVDAITGEMTRVRYSYAHAHTDIEAKALDTIDAVLHEAHLEKVPMVRARKECRERNRTVLRLAGWALDLDEADETGADAQGVAPQGSQANPPDADGGSVSASTTAAPGVSSFDDKVDKMLEAAEESFCNGECNGYLKMLILTRMYRSVDCMESRTVNRGTALASMSPTVCLVLDDAEVQHLTDDPANSHAMTCRTPSADDCTCQVSRPVADLRNVLRELVRAQVVLLHHHAPFPSLRVLGPVRRQQARTSSS
ncbi:Uu.00g025920.m01.CDS01 [Anthostomella pinea]|uniref:Uu.00g025920.m01.CDS01 n=1 Tax=Anthostomella pinea TaxID=933095 RepID=A0AAI8YA53_9PEZI|nr:Uu.00g025920.m01.CDS01 [Anthostomella pinea]